MTIKELKKMWILVLARDYSTTEAPDAWKAFVRNCKRQNKTVQQAYDELKATYDYRQKMGIR